MQTGEKENVDYEVLEEKKKNKQKMERMNRIRNSKYNKWYKRIRTEGIPEYLKRGSTKGKWKRIMRFRQRGK